jgi:RND family efflux transporter MFP subunit
VQAAQIALDQRTITTPVAGTVGLIQVTPGNLINAQTVVTTVDDSSEILVNFWVPERYSSQMTVGTTLAATSAALPGKTFTGTVTAVDNKIDPASRTLQVQATLPNPDGVIKSGMSFSVDMTFPGETFAAVDPLSIQWSNSGAYVWKVVDNKAV